MIDRVFHAYMIVDLVWTLRTHHRNYKHDHHKFMKKIQTGIAFLALRVSMASEGCKFLS